MAAARATSPSPIRAWTPVMVRPSWASRVSWPLNVSKTASAHCLIRARSRASDARRSGRAHERAVEIVVGEGFELASDEALVANQDLAGANMLSVVHL